MKGFTPDDWIDKKEIKKTARFAQFAVAAAQMAMEQAGLTVARSSADRVGVFVGSGIGGFEVIEREHRNLLEKGPDRISPFLIPWALTNLAAAQVSIRIGGEDRIPA